METKIYDILIKNIDIIDGSGSKQQQYMDLAIKGERIEKIGKNIDTNSGKYIIDGTNLLLVPGFIDIHTHTELEVLRNPDMETKLLQGITTELSGNCGIGVFPNEKENKIHLKNITRDILGTIHDEWSWNDLRSFIETISRKGSGTNQGFLTAHAALRITVMGKDSNRAATKDEIEKMCYLLQISFDQGSFGFSSGLYYAPCLFATENELISLLTIVSKNEKLFCVHHRCEGDNILESLQEVLDLSYKTSVTLEISHLKAIGIRNQEKVIKVLQLIESYKKKGLNVKFDQYPYDFGSTSLFSLLPPNYVKLSREELQNTLKNSSERKLIKKSILNPKGWDSIISLCGFENINLLVCNSRTDLEGKSFIEIAKEMKTDCFSAFFDILQNEKGVAVITDITESQDSLKMILNHPLMCFGTDSLFSGTINHPRTTCAAIYLLEKYTKNEKVIKLEEIIKKMTSEVANRMGINDRGIIKEGAYADLNILDYKELQISPQTKRPKGIQYVIINGKIVVINDKLNVKEKPNGKILRSIK